MDVLDALRRIEPAGDLRRLQCEVLLELLRRDARHPLLALPTEARSPRHNHGDLTMHTRMTRDPDEAQLLAAELRLRVGQVVGRFGRITETLVGVEERTLDHGGRPLYQVIPIVSTHDPLFDA